MVVSQALLGQHLRISPKYVTYLGRIVDRLDFLRAILSRRDLVSTYVILFSKPLLLSFLLAVPY